MPKTANFDESRMTRACEAAGCEKMPNLAKIACEYGELIEAPLKIQGSKAKVYCGWKFGFHRHKVTYFLGWPLTESRKSGRHTCSAPRWEVRRTTEETPFSFAVVYKTTPFAMMYLAPFDSNNCLASTRFTSTRWRIPYAKSILSPTGLASR